MSSTSTSAVGLPSAEVQATVPIAYPELPALSAACNKLTDLICKGISKIPLLGCDLIATGIRKLVESDALHLKERILDALSKSHTEFSEIYKNFSEAKGVKESFKALGNMFQWAIGKGFYGLSFACTKMLGWLIALNDSTLENETVRKWLTDLKQDFETAVTFEISNAGMALSLVQQTDEHQVAVAESTTSALPLTTSLAETSDATHDVKTRDQHILEQIQQLLANGGGAAIHMDSENDMISHLLHLATADGTPARFLIILSNPIVPQDA
ncbi:MAG: hypothetical protein LBF43_04750 [Puniceicoccales bacterium]|jgi:hypothetical protein|nr:hypothetical protein [Puniceicoccales bacterium]